MAGKLFLLLAVVPVIELYFLLKVGSSLGALNTVLIILGTAAVGAYLLKQQGFLVINSIRNTANEGRIPGNELLHGFFILLGGITLLTPGFLTDIMGLSMIMPGIRNFYVSLSREFIRKKIETGKWNVTNRRY